MKDSDKEKIRKSIQLTNIALQALSVPTKENLFTAKTSLEALIYICEGK